jgi:hypothetical protein
MSFQSQRTSLNSTPTLPEIHGGIITNDMIIEREGDGEEQEHAYLEDEA